MNNLHKGKAWVYKDNVDTDVIIPARYLNSTNSKELASHCMEDIDSKFAQNVEEGDIIVAGENFGCGSSREHAPIAIKASGVYAVIAKSFARIFFRNAINIGLPIIESSCLPDETEADDELEIDMANGIVKNLTRNKTYEIAPFPPEIQTLISAGGLINYTRQKLERK